MTRYEERLVFRSLKLLLNEVDNKSLHKHEAKEIAGELYSLLLNERCVIPKPKLFTDLKKAP